MKGDVSQMFSIILADDHTLFRQGLRKIMEGVGDLTVTSDVGDGMELLALLPTSAPRMVILDISMPKLNGIEVVRQIKSRHPAVQVLILTMHREYLHQALSAGASGYLVKDDADRELFSAIEMIRQGKVYVSPRLRPEVTEDEGFLPEALSNRETEVLRGVAAGMSNREVAESFGISVRTVEAHRASILGKLNLRNTAELVRYAIEKGFE